MSINADAISGTLDREVSGDVMPETDQRSLRGFHTLSEQVEDLKAFVRNPQQRVHTGLPSLDVICEGPAEGEIMTVIGRSYTGKSQLALNIMVNNPDLRIIFFSLEMPARQALQRLFAMWSGEDHRDLFNQIKAQKIPSHLDEISEALEYQVIYDADGIGLGDMSTIIEQYSEYYGARPNAVIIDYLELLGGGKSSGEGWIATEATATSLKDWAKRERMPVFVLHQTNKQESDWKPPTANSARGGGYTEADIVVGMWSPSSNPELNEIERKALEGEIHMNVIKNRLTGRTRHTPLKFKLGGDLRLRDLTASEVRSFYG